MCGFVGVIKVSGDKSISKDMLVVMNETIKHRGPDDAGYFIDSNVGFGFRRLSIIDLEMGNQPLVDARNRGTIVFNGEIYNYEQLRNDLISKGYKFHTKSDTEVILNLYFEYGFNCLEKLRGMFAFAIYDKEKNKVFIARDRFGIKPLYYYYSGNELFFASELKAILESRSVKREINISAIDSFFTYGYILSPDTIYKSVKKLKPAHFLTIDINSNTVSNEVQYWNPVFNPNYGLSYNESKEMLLEALSDSVEAHLVSDVPVGAFLSGGIDSCSVVSLMAQKYSGSIKTFTIGFEDERYNESGYAKLMAQRVGSSHHELILKPSSSDSIEHIMDLFDEPFADSSAIPTFFVSKLAREHVKVVLSGDGGDELFGGYNTYQRLIKMRSLFLPYFIRKPLFRGLSAIMPERKKGKRFLHTFSNKESEYYAYFNNVYQGEQKKFYTSDIFNRIKENPIQQRKIDLINSSQSSDYISKMMELDILTYLPDDILTKVDRVSMANSLEARVPILDHKFFEVASMIPLKHKIVDNRGKAVFRDAMKDELPGEIFNKKKTGFTVPLHKWFASDLEEYVKSSIKADDPIYDYVNRKYINSILAVSSAGSLLTRLWPILVLNNFLKKHQ